MLPKDNNTPFAPPPPPMPYSAELMEGLALRGQGDLSAADRATMAANYVPEQLGQDQPSLFLKKGGGIQQLSVCFTLKIYKEFGIITNKRKHI